MSVHVLEWDRFLVQGAGWVSFGPRDTSLPGPDGPRQGRAQSARRARRARAERMRYPGPVLGYYRMLVVRYKPE